MQNGALLRSLKLGEVRCSHTVPLARLMLLTPPS